MIRSITLLLFLSFPLLQMAQNKAKVSGALPLEDGEEVRLVGFWQGFSSSDQNATTKSKNGKFTLAPELKGPMIANLYYGGQVQALYLEQGSSLEVLSVAKQLEFKGDLADENRVLADFDESFGSYFQETEIKTRALENSIDLFELDLFAVRQQQEQFLKEKSGSMDLSASFKEMMRTQIHYNYYRSLLAYPILRANASRDTRVNDLPRIIEEEMRPELLGQEQGLNAEAYRRFLHYYVTYFTSRANEFNKFRDMSEAATKRNLLAKEALPEHEYLWVLTDLIYHHYEDMRPSVVKRLFEDLSEWDKEKRYVSLIEEAAGDYMKQKDEPIASKDPDGDQTRPKKGKDNFPFDLVDLNGKTVRIDDFRGKVVYVDFWASWCGPCKMQFPYAKELKHKLSPKEKKQIVFLYISIDNDQETWKKAVEKFGLEGENVYSPGAWGSDAASYFQVNSIPRYVLINKDGRVVDGNAKRPSDPAILDELRSLL